MAVGLADGPEDQDYEPPRLAPGSPAIPDGVPRPLRHNRVFVDTGTIYGTDCRLPLLLLAGIGFLHVGWSPYVASEVARVSTREQALESSKRGADLATLRGDLETRRHEIDRVIEDHEQWWSSPSPDELRVVYEGLAPNAVSDRKDMPVLAAALASGSTFLLSTNTRDFPHGRSHAQLVFWHPDTFLTAYFETDLDAYIFVAQELETYAASMGAQLRP